MRVPESLDLEPGWRQELADFYAEPPRAYHHLGHVEEVVEHYWSFVWEHPNEVFAAVLFHDAIYVPGARDNEVRSAELAVQTLPRWTSSPIDLAQVDRLIRLTAAHGSLITDQVSEEEARFLDCDMAILASDPERYALYEQQIREEYRFVPKEAYEAGRRAFLERVLASPRIYLSDEGYSRWEHRARATLSGVLQRIP